LWSRVTLQNGVNLYQNCHKIRKVFYDACARFRWESSISVLIVRCPKGISASSHSPQTDSQRTSFWVPTFHLPGQRYFLMCVLKKRNSNTKSLAETSLLFTILEYGASCWDPYKEGQINALDRVQKKAA